MKITIIRAIFLAAKIEVKIADKKTTFILEENLNLIIAIFAPIFMNNQVVANEILIFIGYCTLRAI